METNQKKFNSNSKVVKSPHFALIMDKYDKFGENMTSKGFWQTYVLPLDDNIKYLSWHNFSKNISKAVVTKTDLIIEKFVDKKATENQMEKSSLKNILAIGDATLDQLVAQPEILAQIPIKDRMKWLFSAMKARDSRMVALTKVQSEKRKSSMYEDMMQAAQYGEVEEGEFDEPEEESEPEAPTPINISTPKPQATGEVIDFDPNNV